jgi:hypothetical protein
MIFFSPESAKARALMRWVRSNISLGSWCALIAMVTQIALLFGHAHSLDLTLKSRPLTVAVADVGNPSTGESDASSAPSKPVKQSLEYCAICAVINLAASGIPGAAPASPAPVVVRPVRFWANIGDPLAAVPHLLFQSRAPPVG